MFDPNLNLFLNGSSFTSLPTLNPALYAGSGLDLYPGQLPGLDPHLQMQMMGLPPAAAADYNTLNSMGMGLPGGLPGGMEGMDPALMQQQLDLMQMQLLQQQQLGGGGGGGFSASDLFNPTGVIDPSNMGALYGMQVP